MFDYITIKNFLSFKDETKFSFSATNEKAKKGYEHIEWYTEINKKKYLKTLFLFGNNGTGKSNFLAAINALRMFVCRRKSSRSFNDNKLPDTFFRLSSETINKPSTITASFLINKKKYEYSITWNEEIILKESLYTIKNSNKSELIFARNHNVEKDVVHIEFSKKLKSTIISQKIIRENIIPNTSVISLYDEKNIDFIELKEVYNYFNHIIIKHLDDSMLDLCQMLSNRKNDEILKQTILQLLNDLGSNITDYEIIKTTRRLNKMEIDFLRTQMSAEAYNERFPNDTSVESHLRFAHHSISHNDYCWFTEGMESEGTINMIKLIILLFDAAWNDTNIIIDECAIGIHQETFNRIMQFFLSISEHSQAIFASQSLPILDMDGFRRDTARFFDKDFDSGVSTCMSVDLRKFHLNKNIYKNYIDHTFGGIPKIPVNEVWKLHLADFRSTINDSKFNN